MELEGVQKAGNLVDLEGEELQNHTFQQVKGKGLQMSSSVIYPSDLSEREWSFLEPIIPPAKPGGHPRTVDIRRILNGIFYLLRSGCAWRMLPREYGPWSTVSDYFYRWRNDGTWERIHTALREQV